LNLQSTLQSFKSEFRSKLSELEETVSENRRAIEVCGDKLAYVGQIIQSKMTAPVNHDESSLTFNRRQHCENSNAFNRPKAVSAPQQHPRLSRYVLFHESPMLSQIKEFVICSSTEKGNQTPDEPLPQITCDLDQDNGTTIDNDPPETQNDPRYLMVQHFPPADFAHKNKLIEERRKSSPPPLSPFLVEEAFLKKEPLSIRKNDKSSKIEAQEALNSLSKVKDFNDFQQLLKNLKSTLSIEGRTEDSKLTSLFEPFESKVDKYQSRMKKLREKVTGFSAFLQQEITSIQARNPDSSKTSPMVNGSAPKDQSADSMSKAHSFEKWAGTLRRLEAEIAYLQEKYVLIKDDFYGDANVDISRLESRLSQMEDQYRQVYKQVKMYVST